MTFWEYIKNGLPHVTFGEALAAITVFTVAAKGVEDLFKKKSIGNWIYNGIKRFFMIPVTIMKDIQEMKTAVAEIKAEVTINGGLSLKDVVQKSSIQISTNTKILEELSLERVVIDDMDSAMIFRMDGKGMWHNANLSLLHFFDFSEDDVCERGWEKWVHLDDLTQPGGVTDKLHKSLRLLKIFESEHRIKSRHGDYYLCRVTCIPLVDSNGNLIRFRGSIQVINKSQ